MGNDALMLATRASGSSSICCKNKPPLRSSVPWKSRKIVSWLRRKKKRLQRQVPRLRELQRKPSGSQPRSFLELRLRLGRNLQLLGSLQVPLGPLVRQLRRNQQRGEAEVLPKALPPRELARVDSKVRSSGFRSGK